MQKRINPIFIIGAGRSGTNILRDTLTSFPGFITWPCDEINLIFKHGNRQMPHDEFGEAQARPEVKKYIQREFEKLQRGSTGERIIEKTCANSLRVPFLKSIFPEAHFIHIVRDGYDVTHSAMQRWTSSVEIDYLLKKLKFVPLLDIPFYSWSFIKNRVKQAVSREKKLAQWGPIYKGMLSDVKSKTLAEVCALQWAACLKKASEDLKQLPDEQVISLRYEDFVSDPYTHVHNILGKLGKSYADERIKTAVASVSGRSVGKGRSKLDNKTIKNVAPIIDPVMAAYYDKATEIH